MIPNHMHLLFDLDGTLTDPFEGITKCIIHALSELNRPIPADSELTWCIGPPLKNSFAKLLGTEDNRLLEKALSLYRTRFDSHGLYENEVYPGIVITLEKLQSQGHHLHVATSKPEVFALKIMHHFNLANYFDTINGSELDGTRCDKQSLLSYILRQNSIRSESAVMIGDRKHDMIGALENNIATIGVLWGYGSQAELLQSGAEVCLKKPEELLDRFCMG